MIPGQRFNTQIFKLRPNSEYGLQLKTNTPQTASKKLISYIKFHIAREEVSGILPYSAYWFRVSV
jgi:hypothetical protein